MSQSIIEQIVRENLAVYRAARTRLQEDLSQEAQIASDYRGRLIYELLQNADDAMEGGGGLEDRVAFLVTDHELWMANSGRPLNEDDVQGLCGLGASSKVDGQGIRRASIGHKGLGFKSVLEITKRPAIYSETYSFELGKSHAEPHLKKLWQEMNRGKPRGAPSMRFPKTLVDFPDQWKEFSEQGYRTAFSFPFHSELEESQVIEVGDVLLNLPLTAVLFLKHLEHVYVQVERNGEVETREWTISRQRAEADGRWKSVDGLVESGVYRFVVNSDAGESSHFLIAHDADVQIGENRVGLSGLAWEGVEITEVSVAVLLDDTSEEHGLPSEWRHFHVFLPTEEHCPYAMLVNGAFSTDLSRQHVRVDEDDRDYNRFLIWEAARVYCSVLLPELQAMGVEAVLAPLELEEETEEGATAAELQKALIERIADIPLLPTESGDLISLKHAVLPSPALGPKGEQYRAILDPDAVWEGKRFPAPQYCRGRWAKVVTDHGATELSPSECITVLGQILDPERSKFLDDDSGGFEIDPVLEVCEAIWRGSNDAEHYEIEVAVRKEDLFPISVNTDGSVERVALEDESAFYPPQASRHEVPLQDLQFMCHSLCWGALSKKERTSMLKERMTIWNALFDIKEFQFQDVMRAAVLPALGLNPDKAALKLKDNISQYETLASICQLAGVFPKPDRPLRYERLKSDRSLFNLSRMPVPCRGHNGKEEWVPAYRVYFGKDWIGRESVEQVIEAVPGEDESLDDLEVKFLAAPEKFIGLLQDYGDLDENGLGSVDPDDEVSLDEDVDRALETDERARWLNFLTWIGINKQLRLIHFHDVEDSNSGWLTTEGLVRPKGWAFDNLGNTWVQFRKSLAEDIANSDGVVPYLYEVHDLDMIVPILAAAERDASAAIGRQLFEHLVIHWGAYSSFSKAKLALVEKGKAPGMRSAPPRAKESELTDIGDNLWLFRLLGRGFLPTSRGPRAPRLAWLSSQEIERRFSGKGRSASDFMPVLEISDDLPPEAVRSLCNRLGVRGELSPSSFTVEDATQLCKQLETLYSEIKIDSKHLRNVLKPVYRELFELLAGKSGNKELRHALRESPLLAEVGDGYEFIPAHQAIYSGTPGTRERSGVAGKVPLFVLEAVPAARAPLANLFEVRFLENALEWHPNPGECPFEGSELEILRNGLNEIVPSLLARIQAVRTDVHVQDRKIVQEFFKRLEPVNELELSCSLDGIEIRRDADRGYFVGSSYADQPMQVFVLWTGDAWPPMPEVAQNLAMGLADALGVNLVEAFIAFIQGDASQRYRLLELAGATHYLREVEEELKDTDLERDIDDRELLDDSPPTPVMQSGNGKGEKPATLPGQDKQRALPRTPLLDFESLRIDGEPILVFGMQAGASFGSGSGENGDKERGVKANSQWGHGGSIATDLVELDALGMQITIGCELLRLQRLDCTDAVPVVSPTDSIAGNNLVVDVHSPAAIRLAEEHCAEFSQAFAGLQELGIGGIHPGFDILTIRAGKPDRLIELKSSGVDARVQSMTWNEWKSAAHGELRERFWLYLAGNLRADLAHTAPYLRAIQDPFGSLMSDIVTEHQVRKAVQLNVQEFKVAEYLELGVVRERQQ